MEAWPASVARVGGAVVTCGLGEWITSAEASRAVEAIKQGMKCTVVVTADGEEVAFQRARVIVNAAGLDSVGIPSLGEIGQEAEQLIQVHTLLRGMVPVLRLSSAEGQAAPDAPLLANYPGVIVLCGRVGAAATCGARPLLSVTAERLSPASRRQMWTQIMPGLAEHAHFLAARHPVEPTAASE